MIEHSPFQWILFTVGVAVLLFLDLAVFHRKGHEIAFKEAVAWSLFWIGLSLSFGVWVFSTYGRVPALEYLTGYVLELSLSVDNLFVFLLIFSYFKVPQEAHYKVLFWGILGAVVMRFVFILGGVALIHHFEWVMYIFGTILVVSGGRLIFEKEKEVDPSKNILIRLFRRWIPVTEGFHQDRFLIKKDGRVFATPLMIVLLVIETTDIVFAVDSIPAVLSITRDPFIVYTSNIFAILGLRSMYFALAGLMKLFRYLHYGLGAILVFVGLKMILEPFVSVSIGVSLGVIFGTLSLSVLVSILLAQKSPDSTSASPHP